MVGETNPPTWVKNMPSLEELQVRNSVFVPMDVPNVEWIPRRQKRRRRFRVGDVIYSDGNIRQITKVRRKGYSWIYPDVPNREFWSENSNDPLFDWEWKLLAPEQWQVLSVLIDEQRKRFCAHDEVDDPELHALYCLAYRSNHLLRTLYLNKRVQSDSRFDRVLAKAKARESRRSHRFWVRIHLID